MLMYIKQGVAQVTDDGDVLNVTVLSPNHNPQSIIPLMEEYVSEQAQDINLTKLSEREELLHDSDNIYAVSWDSGRKSEFGNVDNLRKFIGN